MSFLRVHIMHAFKLKVTCTVPIDLCLVLQAVIIIRLFFVHIFSGSHSFPGQSLLLSTTVLNDNMHNCVIILLLCYEAECKITA